MKTNKSNNGNGELVPYILDAIKNGINVSTRNKAIKYLSSFVDTETDPGAITSLEFLVQYLDTKAYAELYAYVGTL